MISVILATHNRSAELRRTLGSLALAVPPRRQRWELLVVDNNSTDETAAVLDEFGAPGVLPLRAQFERRQGQSIAMNRGVMASGGEIVAFTDDDVVVAADYLQAIERAVEAHDAIGFGGRVVPRWATHPPAWLVGGEPLRGTNGGVVAYDLGSQVLEVRPGVRPPAGANFFFRRCAFDRYGLMREDLGPNAERQRYANDTEFVWRLQRAGERLLYVPEVVVYHPVSSVRLRRRYSLRWNFRVGRSAARMQGRPRGVAMVGGVPRYLFAMTIGALAERLAVVGRSTPRTRYDRTQEVVYRLGMIYEYLSLPRGFDPEAEVARVRVPVSAAQSADLAPS